ncbi:gliding motility-associated C-terminal domain-containing protein, partial [bacterium]|nr:gliding motility-associated C-terminal domain-containing protein [bacterium]
MKSIFTFFFILFSLQSLSQEICNNGIDDDFDGLIDLNDTTDCNCTIGLLPPIIPNPSFESYSSCPTMVSQIIRVNFWRDALISNSPDYYNCSFSIPAVTTPFPHGTGAVGFAVGNGQGKEYFGACLLDTLHSGVTYNLQFQYAQIASFSPRPIAIFGSNNCANIPYPNTPIGGGGITTNCPSLGPNWVTLDTLIPIVNTNSWNTYTFTFTPTFDITTIIFGPSCAILTSPAPQAYYGTIDNLQLSYVSPTVNITDTGHYCRNNLVLTANFDSIPNSFQWYKNGIALVNDTTISYSVPISGAGDYQVVLSYNYGCLLSATYTIDSTIIDFDYDSSGSCLFNPTGSINVNNMIGGTIPYQFNANSLPFKTDSSFSSLSPGIYSISVRDSNLCIRTKNVTIVTFPQPVASFIADTVCLGEMTNLTDKSSINKGLITNWSWSAPIITSTSNTNYTFTNGGSNPVTLTVTSDSGCVDDTTIDVIVNPLPILDFDFTPKSIFTYNTAVCFANYTSGAVSYLWNFDFIGPNGTSILNSPCPVVFPDDKEAIYYIKLIAINQFGCIDSLTKTLNVKDDFTLYIPNSFTPNQDNTNEELKIYHNGIINIEWTIFNRWGEQIFFSSDLNS